MSSDKSVEITNSYTFPSNSQKIKIHKERISHIINVNKKHKVVILKPIIDKIALTIYGISAFCAAKGVDHKTYWKKTGGLLMDAINDSSRPEIESCKITYYKVGAKLNVGPNGAAVYLGMLPDKSKHAPVRLEFNPSHFGPESLSKLCSIWEFIDFDNIPFPALMADAKITRLDVAIDILNLALADLFVYYSKGHKVWTASSSRGGIQTQQFYTDKQHSASLSPKKRANLIVYDKRQEQKDRGNKPFYGDLEHIRIEPSLKKYNSLIALKNTKFPLSGWSFQNIISKNRPIRVKRWRAFKDSVRIRGVEAAEKLLDKAEFEKYFAEKYTNFAKNIVTEEIWSHWPEAIERAHIELLIEWAYTLPEKFIPPGLLSKGS